MNAFQSGRKVLRHESTAFDKIKKRSAEGVTIKGAKVYGVHRGKVISENSDKADLLVALEHFIEENKVLRRELANVHRI